MVQTTTGATKVNVRPSDAHSNELAVIEIDEQTRIVADSADVDGSDNLTFYRENVSIAHVKVSGVPLEVPNMVRRAIRFGELNNWE